MWISRFLGANNSMWRTLKIKSKWMFGKNLVVLDFWVYLYVSEKVNNSKSARRSLVLNSRPLFHVHVWKLICLEVQNLPNESFMKRMNLYIEVQSYIKATKNYLFESLLKYHQVQTLKRPRIWKILKAQFVNHLYLR